MNDKYFIHYDFYNMKSNQTLTILPKFQTFQQTTEYTCGPVCLKMVLNYYGFDYPENFLEKLCKSKPYKGTTIKNLEQATKTINNDINCLEIFSSLNTNKPQTYHDFKNFILNNLKNNTPVIVENVDYGGHYKVVIGYDEINNDSSQDMLIFADPYDNNDGKIDGYNYFPAERFFYMWFDNHCLDKDERKNPFLVIKKI